MNSGSKQLADYFETDSNKHSGKKMAILRVLKPMMASACALSLAACAYGTGTASDVAVAKSAAASSNSNLYTLATDMAAKGDHEGAIPLFRHLAATSRSPQAITGLADSQMAMGNLESAFGILQALVRDQSTPLPGMVYYSYGKAALALGEFEAALSGFSRAAILLPADPRPRSGKAIALAASGQTTQALAALDGASDASSLSNKALVLAASGAPDAAVDILEPLLSTGQAEARDRQNLAMAYLLAGREDKAYQVARLDLDAASVDTTFTFYRSLESLEVSERMQALVTGTIDPAWSRQDTANLTLENTDDRKLAAHRFVSEPKLIAKAPAPEPVQQKVVPADYKPEEYKKGDVPPLLEPEGWALQIGAYRSIERLMRGWNILYERNIDILSDIPPRRSEMDFGTREDGPSGFYYRLNAGPLKTLAEARTLCEELKTRGTRCWIRPPETTEGKLPGTSDTSVAEAQTATGASR